MQASKQHARPSLCNYAPTLILLAAPLLCTMYPHLSCVSSPFRRAGLRDEAMQVEQALT